MSETERLKKVVEENESNSRFHNFAECLCESYQREELVKAVIDRLRGCSEEDDNNQARLDRKEQTEKDSIFHGEKNA